MLNILRWPLAIALVCSLATSLGAADLKVLLPLGRTAYQTNEQIDLAVVRSATEALPAGELANNVFRFARQHHEVTIVKGTSPFNTAAAERLTSALAPWGVRTKTMDLGEAAKARTISAEEARTWVGLGFGRVKAGTENPPSQVGFAVEGPTILLGNPGDHPIIAYLQKERFLPYQPEAGTIPGRTRGYVAWQRDGVQKGQESVTLIAYDEAGMQEAVGTMFEAVAGLEPLTRLELPKSVSITPAQSVPGKTPSAQVAWRSVVPDRVVSLSAENGTLAALSHDGSLTAISGEGKLGQASVLDWPAYKAKADGLAKPDAAAIAAQQKRSGPGRLVKLVVPHGGLTAVAYWGGRVELVDAEGKIKFANKLPQDVTALASVGDKLVVGLANGQVLGLSP